MKLDLKGRLLFLFVCSMQPYSTESFNWTLQPANPTSVTKGEDESLTWEFNLTADEQAKSKTFYLIKWKKFNQANSNYDQIAGQTFVSAFGTIVYNVPRAPHIEVDKKKNATLLINNVTTEDEGTYKIEYSLQPDGTVLADHEVNVTVLEPPQVVVSNDQDVCEGSTVTLSCNATGKPIPNITWTKEGENGSDSGPLPSVDGLYVISNSNKSLNGTYRCTASNGVGDPANQTTKVIVGNSSSVDGVVISSNTAVEGYPYNLSCEASGVPEPSVSWIKVSSSKHHAGKLLNFTSISRNDAGKYTCEASNRCGKDSKTEAINVFFGPEITQFTTSAVHHKVCQNGVISLNCAADAYPPVTSYQLFENGSAILDTNTSGMWSRNMSTRGVFIYKCLANNTYETGNSGMIPINVSVPPSIQEIDNQTITEGNNVTLTCQASGDPTPELFWIKPNGQRVTKNVLTLTNITSNETGDYRCEATNYCGNVSRTASIDVQYGPKIPIESSNCKEYIKKDDHFTMECPVEGNPQPNITWSEGGRILSHNKSKITLKSQHIGEHIYTCTADNGIGEPVSLTFLHVVNDIVKKDFIYKMKEKSEFTRQLSEDNKKQIEVQEKITKVIPECHKHEVGKIEFRPGSIIIYIHLSFEKPMGQEALTSMFREAARKGHLGKNIVPDSITDVSDIPAKHKCSGLYEDDQICKTIKTLWIVVIAVVVLVFAVVIIIIIYMVHKRRKCRRKDQRIHSETDERQAFSSNHSTLSGTNPYAELKSGYAMSGPQPQGESVIEQGEGAVGGEPPAEIVIEQEHSKKKHRKKDKKAAEQKPTEDQYAVADKSKRKKKNEPDATYAEVDLSKKAKKKPKPGEVLYADLGEFHKTQEMPDVSTSPKTLSLTKRPEAYTETPYADITQFLKGNPQETSAEPPEDGTTLPSVSAQATNETGF